MYIKVCQPFSRNVLICTQIAVVTLDAANLFPKFAILFRTNIYTVHRKHWRTNLNLFVEEIKMCRAYFYSYDTVQEKLLRNMKRKKKFKQPKNYFLDSDFKLPVHFWPPGGGVFQEVLSFLPLSYFCIRISTLADQPNGQSYLFFFHQTGKCVHVVNTNCSKYRRDIIER